MLPASHSNTRDTLKWFPNDWFEKKIEDSNALLILPLTKPWANFLQLIYIDDQMFLIHICKV